MNLGIVWLAAALLPNLTFGSVETAALTETAALILRNDHSYTLHLEIYGKTAGGALTDELFVRPQVIAMLPGKTARVSIVYSSQQVGYEKFYELHINKITPKSTIGLMLPVFVGPGAFKIELKNKCIKNAVTARVVALGANKPGSRSVLKTEWLDAGEPGVEVLLNAAGVRSPRKCANEEKKLQYAIDH